MRGLTDEDIWRLDLFEGDEYERRRVRVQIMPANEPHHTPSLDQELDAAEAREEMEAETYIWIAGEHRLEDEEWDFDEFVKEKMWRWAPSEEVRDAGGGGTGSVEDEDEGFEDVRRAVEERGKQGGKQDHDATGGRVFGGAFESTVRQSKDRTNEDEVIESAV